MNTVFATATRCKYVPVSSTPASTGNCSCVALISAIHGAIGNCSCVALISAIHGAMLAKVAVTNTESMFSGFVDSNDQVNNVGQSAYCASDAE